ncbi:MAG TPA: glucose-6-phosphate dehydrogenase, partial [Rubrobacteraceae bacterium]
MKRIVILGATGDLTARYLMPALAKLYEEDKLPPGIKIIGVDRRGWDHEHGFRRLIMENLERHAGGVSANARASMALETLEYRQADVTDPESVISALEPLTEPIIVYLALPPAVFVPTIEALKRANLPEGSRVAIEKPFGVNLESAQALNRLLHEFLPEKAIFRIDHFLAWQPFPTIIGLRFANGIFEPLWDRNHVERVEIFWEETLALEGRAGYFDNAGAFKDLIQNHLLQLLCLTAMEAPTALHRRNLRDRKLDVLRAIRRLSPEEAPRHSVRARYGVGRIGERHIPAYVDEEGVDHERETETFAQVTLMIDNLRWAGVPFVLRAGKALSSFRGEI